MPLFDSRTERTFIFLSGLKMGKSRVMLPVTEVDLAEVKYESAAPHLTGTTLKLFVRLIEMPVIGHLIIWHMKKQNRIDQILNKSVVPETPMYKPEFPPQEPEPSVIALEEDGKPEDRVGLGFKCLKHYDAASCWVDQTNTSFRYWTIRDYAYAYRSKFTTPSMVAERIISVMEEIANNMPPMPMLISFDPEDVRKQAAASTQRFEEGNPISILDGIFMTIKDDIDCLPHPSKGGTTWYHEVRPVKKDAVSVSKLRSCGVVFVGKGNMHELGLGTTGNNSNHGTVRNPHAPERYTGGSSSGPAAIVAAGICSAALGTDAGGSVRIPASLCGVVGLKTTYGRTDMTGSILDVGTVEIIGPIASNVEDVILVYSAILGSSPANRISLKPSPPCLPDLSSSENIDVLASIKLGKYTKWFNDVFSSEISEKCDRVLKVLIEKYGCKTSEVVVPEMKEMLIAHMVSTGSEYLGSHIPHCKDGNGVKLNYDSRTNMAIFQSLTASDYVVAQRMRRRLMYYYTEIFNKVDVIVTPTTGMTAPVIPPDALKFGESDLKVTGNLMRYVISANLLGFPAISVPVGYDKQGLPIGLQFIGRPWAEATILRLAAAVEELNLEPKKKPKIFYDILKKTS
ncbi:fatty acid amide hydrolase-like isoform X2 [Impatiens glandulifera]|uniref:fatty acid amide hydrolase-like isoform X2 n=1 Tax=Impatiens glandulifera TaxID=253017 RepID=UPI001FB1436B|nr:fatty acid amide hydrolase-like isoform X2 [Impatiens glandulifera]